MVMDYHQHRIPCRHLIWSRGTVTRVHRRNPRRVLGAASHTVESSGVIIEGALAGFFLRLCLRFSTHRVADCTSLRAAIWGLCTWAASVRSQTTFDRCHLAAQTDSCGCCESHSDTHLVPDTYVQAQVGQQVLRHRVADVNGIFPLTDDTGFTLRLVAKHTRSCTPPHHRTQCRYAGANPDYLEEWIDLNPPHHQLSYRSPDLSHSLSEKEYLHLVR